MTLPVEELVRILSVAAEYRREEASGQDARIRADLVGVNMEGPFISKMKKGAQDERNILPCDASIARRFLEASEGLVKFIGIAPEESEHSAVFVKEMRTMSIFLWRIQMRTMTVQRLLLTRAPVMRYIFITLCRHLHTGRRAW